MPASDSSAERLLVCVSPSPFSARLVAAGSRIAQERGCDWFGVYVEVPNTRRLSDEESDRVARTLRLVEHFGGEPVTLIGANVVGELVRFAQERNVTEIVIGKSLRPRWHELLRGSVVVELIRRCENTDIHVVRFGERTLIVPQASRIPKSRTRLRVERYAFGTIAVIIAGIVAETIEAFVALPNLSLVFLAAVLVSAVRHGLSASVFTSALAVLVYNFFFVQPLYTFTVGSAEDLLTLTMFLATSVLTSHLASRVRNHAEAAKQREAATAALYALSRDVASARSLPDVLGVIVRQVTELIGARVVVLLPGAKDGLRFEPYPLNAVYDDPEDIAATWVRTQGQVAGLGTATFSHVRRLYLPLRTTNGIIGVVGIEFQRDEAVTSARQRLLDALLDQSAIAIERTQLAQTMESARLESEAEKLRSTLLLSVSHDLRTPLASIVGSATALLENDAGDDVAMRHDLLQTIQEQAFRLSQFVGNLLEMARLEAGAFALKRESVDIEDVIESALSRAKTTVANHRVTVSVEPELPVLSLDLALMQQTLVNLLDNAAKYSPFGSTVAVSARREGDALRLAVSDEGCGVPPSELERIFGKFYRTSRGDHRSAGTGLGLAICRGWVQAHGGRIAARSPLRDGKGTEIIISLPIESESRQESER